VLVPAHGYADKRHARSERKCDDQRSPDSRPTPLRLSGELCLAVRRVPQTHEAKCPAGIPERCRFGARGRGEVTLEGQHNFLRMAQLKA
jgi:hypothetical protein